MGDEQERHAGALQRRNLLKQPGDAGAVQLRGGLVEDDEPARTTRPGDSRFCRCPRQSPGQPARIDLDAQLPAVRWPPRAAPATRSVRPVLCG